MVRTMAVLWDVEWLLRGVKELEDIRWRRRVYNRSGDELIHCFVVGGFSRVVHDASTAAVDSTTKEGHPNGFLMSNAL